MTNIPRIHSRADYGEARHELDALFHDWTVLSSSAEARGYADDAANQRAAVAWNRYEERRTAAMLAEWTWQPVVYELA